MDNLKNLMSESTKSQEFAVTPGKGWSKSPSRQQQRHETSENGTRVEKTPLVTPGKGWSKSPSRQQQRHETSENGFQENATFSLFKRI